jgi:hypothetical protein
MKNKINTQAIENFLTAKTFSNQNRKVLVEGEKTILKLYSTRIAVLENEKLFITVGEFPTKLTKGLLNSIPDVSISTVKGNLFLNGKEWNGELIEVK